MHLLKARSSLFVMKIAWERIKFLERFFSDFPTISLRDFSACGNRLPIKNGCSRLQFLLLLKILNLTIVGYRVDC